MKLMTLYVEPDMRLTTLLCRAASVVVNELAWVFLSLTVCDIHYTAEKPYFSGSGMQHEVTSESFEIF
jgi:hypothetical protein